MRRLSWTSSTYLGQGQFYSGKTSSRGLVQEVHLLTSQANITEFFQYVVSSENGFSEMGATTGERYTGLLHRSLVVVVSALYTQ